ncbi:cysteine desulfurase family protein [Hellea balneolensis]|uniref:cysteine desulfurase family protein n=1 Tax=Hellea balneolensis TaxID=287478 RepID=UPI00041E3B73|nr:cysteine desulfurase family protein [Hellea balneolensis]
MTRTYLDHNATSPIRSEVIEAVTAAMAVEGNPSAQHGDGRAAKNLISNAREAVGLAMGVCAQDIVFTGCGTEALNTAVFSAWTAGCRKMLFSYADHPATYRAADQWRCPHEFIPLSENGVTDVAWLKDRLKNWDEADGRIFVSVVAANSETGVIQPIEQIADIVSEVGGLLLVDAVQALGKIPMTYIADYIAISAHKIGGPQGVGALYMAPEAPAQSLLCGGGQERRRRAGTMNVAGIAGFGAAVKAMTDLDHTRELRDALEAGLKSMEPELTIFGEGVERLPNTSFFAIPDVSSMTAMMSLDLEGISVSTGTACSSGKVGESRAIKAMGLSDKSPKGAIRISFGYNSTMADVEHFLSAWAKIRKIKRKAA